MPQGMHAIAIFIHLPIIIPIFFFGYVNHYTDFFLPGGWIASVRKIKIFAFCISQGFRVIGFIEILDMDRNR